MPESRRRYLTMAELEALAAGAGPCGSLIRVLDYCGLRWGEAVALTVTPCDLLRSRLIVDRSLADINGVLSVGTAKSGKRREVPLSRFLRDELAVHLAGKEPVDLVFPVVRGGTCGMPTFAAPPSTRPHVRRGSPDSFRTNSGTPRRRWQSGPEPTSRSSRR
jgi:integrase